MRSGKSFLMTVKIACNLMILFTLLFSSTVGSASCAAVFAGDFVIRQETVRLGSVLVARPSEIDTRIAGFLGTHDINTPDKYAMWLAKNIKYKADAAGDIWSSPKETLDRLYGDCEDYALLSAAVLRVLGYESKIMVLGTSGQDHAICVFEKDGHYLWFDNNELKRTDIFTMRKFGEHIFKKYACSRISEINVETKKCSVLYIRSA